MSEKSPKLTEKEELAAHEYVINGRNEVAAARAAGYSMPEKHAWKVFRRPHVQEFVEQLYSDRNRRMGVSRDYVMAELLDQLQVLKAEIKPKLNSKTGKPIEDEDGNPIYVRNEAGITKVLELIGKLAGVDAFNEKMKVEVTREKEILDAMEAGSERLKNAPKFDSESGTD